MNRYSIRQESRQIFCCRAGELQSRFQGFFRIVTLVERDEQADDGAIAAASLHSVPHQIKLAPVFAGDDAAVLLIPIKDQRPLAAVLNDISIHLDRLSALIILE